MPFDWTEYLSLARGWAEGELTEALARSAVSRAYYAAYHHALAYAVARLGHRRQGLADEHRWIRDKIEDADKAGVANSLDRLRQHRNNCDYTDELINVETNILPQALDLAHRVITALDI